MKPGSILFLCVANSARSQMAEALAKDILGPEVLVQSAGSAPSVVNPYAKLVLDEIGLSTDGHRSKHVDTIDPGGVDLVITLCAEESCPLFLGDAERRSWAMPDPDRKEEDLTEEERVQCFREAREKIKARVLALKAEWV